MEDQFFRLGAALAIGLLIGLERGWREREQPAGSRTAGLRTFGILGLLGGLLALLAVEFAAPLVYAAGLLCVAAVFGLFQFLEAEHDHNFSVTGVMAGLGVFGLGGLAIVGDYRVAAAGGAALAVILASREILHTTLRRLTWIELRSALVLAVMTTIVLPMLPNRAIDPWGGLNPWEIWFFTVLIAAISFAGYFAVRTLGPTRGLLVSTLAGSLASSTAVTVALARMATAGPQVRALVGAAALAGMVSILRVLLVVALLRRDLMAQVTLPALMGAAVLGAAGLSMLTRSAPSQQPDDGIGNPFEMRALLVFAALFALVSTASAALVHQVGGSSLAAVSALSGMFDVDVAVLSAVRLDAASVDLSMVGHAILLALCANAAGRISLAVLAGPARFWLPLSATTLVAVSAGAVVYLLSAAG